MNGIRMHIKEEFEKQGRFSNGRRLRNASASVSTSDSVEPARTGS